MNDLDYGKIFPIPQTEAEVATSVGTTEENFEHLWYVSKMAQNISACY